MAQTSGQVVDNLLIVGEGNDQLVSRLVNLEADGEDLGPHIARRKIVGGGTWGIDSGAGKPVISWWLLVR